jgi:hypothetical protein
LFREPEQPLPSGRSVRYLVAPLATARSPIVETIFRETGSNRDFGTTIPHVHTNVHLATDAR